MVLGISFSSEFEPVRLKLFIVKMEALQLIRKVIRVPLMMFCMLTTFAFIKLIQTWSAEDTLLLMESVQL